MLVRENLLQMIEALGGDGSVVYLSLPITSGRREVALLQELGLSSPAELRARFPDRWLAEVKDANVTSANEHASELRRRRPNELVLNPASLENEGWTQNDYNGLWLDVIDRYVKVVVLAPDWEWSRGARLEVGMAVSSGRPLETFDGQDLSPPAALSMADDARRSLSADGFSDADVDRLLPNIDVATPQLEPSAASQTFTWLVKERKYQVEKFGVEADDEHTREGVSPDSWWWQQLTNYLYRAGVLGLDTPVGRQALAKFNATACGLTESVIRVHGALPPPGVPSGEGLTERVSESATET